MKNKGGRPIEIDREALRANFITYINQAEIPIVSEFAYQNGLYREQMYQIEEIQDLVQLCITKKEVALEQKALSGGVNCTMAIFSLKQIGWKDQQTHELTGKNGGPITVQASQTDEAL